MNVSHFSKFVLLTAIALITSWIVKQYDTNSERIIRLPVADITIESLNAREYNSSGELYHQLVAKKLEHFKEQSQTTMEKPVVNFFEDNVILWNLSSEHGKVSSNREKIELNGNVVIRHNNNETHAISKLSTKSIDIYYKKMLASTDQPIILRDENQIITATGLRVNFKKQSIIQLLSNVKGTLNAL